MANDEKNTRTMKITPEGMIVQQPHDPTEFFVSNAELEKARHALALADLPKLGPPKPRVMELQQGYTGPGHELIGCRVRHRVTGYTGVVDAICGGADGVLCGAVVDPDNDHVMPHLIPIDLLLVEGPWRSH